MSDQLPEELWLDQAWYESDPDRYRSEERWFKKIASPPFSLLNHPALTTDGEVEEYVSERVAWRGTVEVRIRQATTRETQVDRFVVDFVYPDIYPFDRIEVYPVEPKIRGARHQNPRTGEICYLPEHPNGWNPEYHNRDIIGRVRNWFLGYCTNWVLGSHVDVPELDAYLSPTTKAGLNLLSFDPHYGRMSSPYGYAALFVDVREPTSQGDPRFGYIGNLTSTNGEPIVTLNQQIVERTKPILQIPDKLQRLRAIWFELGVTPRTIQNVNDLVAILCEVSGKTEDDVGKMIWNSGSSHGADQNGLYVGLIYPDTRTNRRIWSILQLIPGHPTVPVIKKGKQRKKRVPGFQRVLTGKLYIVPVHPLREEEIFRRSRQLLPDASLGEKKIALVGVGAIGSTTIQLLAKAGVRSFVVCDGDVMAVGNVARHLCGLSFLARRKDVAVENRLVTVNPFIELDRVSPIKDKSTLREFHQNAQDCDVIVAATGDETIDRLLNRYAIETRKTVVFVRAMDRMRVGRVIRFIPGRDACLTCLLRHRANPGWIDAPSERESDLIYDDGCGLPAVPGAATDTELVGNLAARMTLDYLLKAERESNHWVWCGQDGGALADPRVYPLHCHQQTFRPYDDCPECRNAEARTVVTTKSTKKRSARKPTGEVRIVVLSDVIARMKQEAIRVGDLETGGVLLGKWSDDGKTLTVTEATSPGPHAIHQEHGFIRDREYCQGQIDRIHSASTGTIDYIGEWHRHGRLGTTPSPTDRESILGLVESSNYDLETALLIIYEMEDESTAVKGYLGQRGGMGLTETEVHLGEQ